MEKKIVNQYLMIVRRKAASPVMFTFSGNDFGKVVDEQQSNAMSFAQKLSYANESAEVEVWRKWEEGQCYNWCGTIS